MTTKNLPVLCQEPVSIMVTKTKDGGWAVHQNGEVSGILCWGEMVEEVIHRTHSDLRVNRYSTISEDLVFDLKRKNKALRDELAAAKGEEVIF